MDKAELVKAIRLRSYALRNADEEAPTIGDLSNDGELLTVLARIVEGTPVYRAFGSPGDWGYNHPIGRALAAKEGQ